MTAPASLALIAALLVGLGLVPAASGAGRGIGAQPQAAAQAQPPEAPKPPKAKQQGSLAYWDMRAWRNVTVFHWGKPWMTTWCGDEKGPDPNLHPVACSCWSSEIDVKANNTDSMVDSRQASPLLLLGSTMLKYDDSTSQYLDICRCLWKVRPSLGTGKRMHTYTSLQCACTT